VVFPISRGILPGELAKTTRAVSAITVTDDVKLRPVKPEPMVSGLETALPGLKGELGHDTVWSRSDD
jgi:hypothetical protein